MKSSRFALVEEGKGNSCCGCCFCTKTQRRVSVCIVSTPILLLLVLILALIIKAAFLESPFVLQNFDANPRFINASDQEKTARAQALASAIQFPTISYNASHINTEAMVKLRSFLYERYDTVFSSSFVEVSANVIKITSASFGSFDRYIFLHCI